MKRARSSASAEEVDAVLAASRALVGIAARSLADLPDTVTLPQYRALVVLASAGATPIGDLAAELGVHPSTCTRLVDRLVQRQLVRRVSSGSDRRVSPVELTDAGRKLIASVTRRRLRDLRWVLERLDGGERRSVADALATFARAAGSLADASWKLGWEVP
jgi:DNA-binding MarR family transcriptional regulator